MRSHLLEQSGELRLIRLVWNAWCTRCCNWVVIISLSVWRIVEDLVLEGFIHDLVKLVHFPLFAVLLLGLRRKSLSRSWSEIWSLVHGRSRWLAKRVLFRNKRLWFLLSQRQTESVRLILLLQVEDLLEKSFTGHRHFWTSEIIWVRRIRLTIVVRTVIVFFYFLWPSVLWFVHRGYIYATLS